MKGQITALLYKADLYLYPGTAWNMEMLAFVKVRDLVKLSLWALGIWKDVSKC